MRFYIAPYSSETSMRPLLSLIGLAVIASACDTKAFMTSTPTPAMEKRGRGEERIPQGGARFVSPGELSKEQIRAVEAHASEIEEETAQRRVRNSQSPERYGFVSKPLPDGAVAVVVRDPASPIQRMHLYSEQSFSDLAHILALAALDVDEKQVPTTTERRLLYVFSDQRVRIVASEKAEELQLGVHLTDPNQRVLSGLILRALPQASTMSVRGFGTVRVLPAPDS